MFTQHPLCVCVCPLSRHDLASVRGVPGHLGLHAVHSRHLQHHSVSVPRPGVRDMAPHSRGVAAHPHHGHLQHVRLCRQGKARIRAKAAFSPFLLSMSWICSAHHRVKGQELYNLYLHLHSCQTAHIMHVSVLFFNVILLFSVDEQL